MSATRRSTDTAPTVSVKKRSETALDDAARTHGTVSSSLPKRDGSSGRMWRTYLLSSNCASSCSCWTVLSSVRPAVSTTVNHTLCHSHLNSACCLPSLHKITRDEQRKLFVLGPDREPLRHQILATTES